jgi:hypothetical protein
MQPRQCVAVPSADNSLESVRPSEFSADPAESSQPWQPEQPTELIAPAPCAGCVLDRERIHLSDRRETSMRCLLSSVVACLFLAGPAGVLAQGPDPSSASDPATANYNKIAQPSVDTTALPGDETPPAPVAAKKTPRLKPQPRARVVISPESAARLLHERAMTQARMRRARIEARKWAGVSLLRPTVADERPAYAADWGVAAGSPWWWSTSSSRLRMQW